ncbi:MAG TPA: hypothetical protein VFW66_03725 [Gemmatimonadales bacterium]|nr:hypothetical protein [Gemmatimonadales bacterium]
MVEYALLTFGAGLSTVTATVTEAVHSAGWVFFAGAGLGLATLWYIFSSRA